MNSCIKYKAFGLVIESDVPIAQLPIAENTATTDVRILCKPLGTSLFQEGHYKVSKTFVSFIFEKIGKFCISNGNTIEVEPFPECTESHLGVYLMGTCMGAILHQRGYMPLHGSCVTDGKRSILITGDSGAGKSTLAAEFLSRGWKLLTDDVAAVSDIDGVPVVQSSYPSQKLWQDSLAQYDRSEDDIHSLYFSDTREKYGVDASRFFLEGQYPLNMVLRLLPTDSPCSLTPIEGMARADQLMRNTYRIFLIAPENRQRHFQRCVTMTGKIPMALITRQNGMHSAPVLYDMITKHLGEINHE